MSYEFILTEQKGRVGVVTLNRPKQLNALNAKLMQELAAALYAYDADPGIPTDPKTTMGAIVSKVQYDRVLSYIEAGKQDGARRHCWPQISVVIVRNELAA